MDTEDVSRVEIPDDLVAFVLPEGRGEFVCCPLDTIEELVALEARDQAKGWRQVVVDYVKARMPEDTKPLTLGQAENFLHALKVSRAKKKVSHDDALNAAQGSPSFTDSTPAS